ncbi:hypothetical protein [Streptomyces sp. NPDC101165]|uniref:hypothetical protein n=1 Tax=Streptomyces sp. NPDC101165 TaxID=3366119 RepID=UPI0038126D2F
MTTRSKTQVWGARLACAGLTTAVALGIAASPASAARLPGPPSAAGVQPVEYDASVTCADILGTGAFTFAFQQIPVNSGTFTFAPPNDNGSVTLSVHGPASSPLVDFGINGPYAARGIIVRGASTSNFYGYQAPDFPNGIKSDEDLHAPLKPATDTFFNPTRFDVCGIPSNYS